MKLENLVVAAAVVGAVACKGGDGDGGAVGPVELPTLGLTIQLPAKAKVTSDEMLGLGIGVTISQKGFNDLSVSVDKTAATIESAKSVIGISKPRNLKTDSLADGFLLTYEADNQFGPYFGFALYRTIAGKPTQCASFADTDADRVKLLAECKSLVAK